MKSIDFINFIYHFFSFFLCLKIHNSVEIIAYKNYERIFFFSSYFETHGSFVWEAYWVIQRLLC